MLPWLPGQSLRGFLMCESRPRLPASTELPYVFGEFRRALASRGDGRIPVWEIGGFWAQSLLHLFPPNRSENELWFLQDFKTLFFFFFLLLFVHCKALHSALSWGRARSKAAVWNGGSWGHEGRPGGACRAWGVLACFDPRAFGCVAICIACE